MKKTYIKPRSIEYLIDTGDGILIETSKNTQSSPNKLDNTVGGEGGGVDYVKEESGSSGMWSEEW